MVKDVVLFEELHYYWYVSYEYDDNEKSCPRCGLYLKNGICSNCYKSGEKRKINVDLVASSEKSSYEVLSPTLSIWFHPRKTMRFLEDKNKVLLGFLIVLLVCFIKTVNLAVYFELGEKLSVLGIFEVCFILSLLKAGFIYIVVAKVLFKSCQGFQGEASLSSIKKVIEWSSIPLVFSVLLWVPEFMIVGGSFFKSNSSLIDANTLSNSVYISLSCIDTVLALWSLILFIICLAEVNRFSLKQAIFSSIIALIVFLIPGMFFSGVFIAINEYLHFSF